MALGTNWRQTKYAGTPASRMPSHSSESLGFSLIDSTVMNAVDRINVIGTQG